MKRKNRSWVPLYIVGKDCFQKAVIEALEDSDLPFMPGYLFDNSLSSDHGMLWIDEKVSIRDYKKAIGGKLIWKHRLRFFTNLDEFNLSSRVRYDSDEEFDTAA